jgi:phospho-N-acetylmuramoyl-pentapeptide-transferase
MGGIAIVAGSFSGYVISDLYQGVFTHTGIFVILAIGGAGLVGFLDDWIKVTRERNLGLTKTAKSVGLLAVATCFAVLTVSFTEVDTHLSFTRGDQFNIDLGPVGWVVWAVVLIYATSNAVNLTDGLDGLCAGSSSLCFAAMSIIAFWAFRNEGLYNVDHALDLAVIGAAMLGGCVGFLWWNAAPARIFMGDTGSLAIGTGLACLALTTNTHLLLPIIGGLFVMEAASVILQVFYFRVLGRRILRMAPIHHHFELLGWPETTVIIRFWIIASFCVAIGLGLFLADFISINPVNP